jgi:hypothetical protein
MNLPSSAGRARVRGVLVAEVLRDTSIVIDDADRTQIQNFGVLGA